MVIWSEVNSFPSYYIEKKKENNIGFITIFVLFYGFN